MTIKKTITTAITTTLLLGVLAACSTGQTQTPEPPTRTDPTSSNTGTSEDPTPEETSSATPSESETPVTETDDFTMTLNIPGGIPQKYLDEFSENANWGTLGPSVINTVTYFGGYSQFQSAPFDPASPLADLFFRDVSVLFFDDAHLQFKEAITSDTNRVFALFPHYPVSGLLPGLNEALEIDSERLWSVKYANPQYTGVSTTTPVTGITFTVDVQTSVPLVGGQTAQVVQTLNLTMLPMGDEWIVGDFSSSEPVTTVV